MEKAIVGEVYYIKNGGYGAKGCSGSIGRCVSVVNEFEDSSLFEHGSSASGVYIKLMYVPEEARTVYKCDIWGLGNRYGESYELELLR